MSRFGLVHLTGSQEQSEFRKGLQWTALSATHCMRSRHQCQVNFQVCTGFSLPVQANLWRCDEIGKRT